MRVLLDTNVLIAAFITHCIHRHQLVTSEFILNEFRKHMIGKFQYSPDETEEALELLRKKMEVVTPIQLDQPVCRDPDDDGVLGTALAGNAACIVTGDKDLLVLQHYGSIDILSPAQFSAYEATRES